MVHCGFLQTYKIVKIKRCVANPSFMRCAGCGVLIWEKQRETTGIVSQYLPLRINQIKSIKFQHIMIMRVSWCGMGTIHMQDKPQFSPLYRMRSGEQCTRGRDKYCRKVMTFDYFPPNVKMVVSISLQKIHTEQNKLRHFSFNSSICYFFFLPLQFILFIKTFSFGDYCWTIVGRGCTIR